MSRRYRRMGRDIRTAFDTGMISTSSPRTMTPEDVRHHLIYRRGLGLSQTEYSHEYTAMMTFFDFCGNPAVRTCIRKYPGLRPSRDKGRLPTLADGDLVKVVQAFSKVPQLAEFRLIRSYAMLAVFLGCGCRTKELRLLDLKDLDTEAWTLDMVHVKEEHFYGAPRIVPVPPMLCPILLSYLIVRADHCREDAPTLFPPMIGSTAHLSANVVRRTLSFALDDIGISTDPRILRRTFGQIYLDADIDSIESVSVLMGHSSTLTTERYYARGRRNDAAIEAARRTWSKENSNPLCRNDRTGDDPDDTEEEGRVRLSGFERL